MVSGRVADFVLLVVTVVELGLLFVLVPRFTVTDWIYVVQHLLELGIALTRHPPRAQDRSRASTVAVGVSYAYPPRWRCCGGDPVTRCGRPPAYSS